MNEHLKQHYIFLVVFMVVLCLLSISLTVWAVRGAETIHAVQTYEEIDKIKKVYLKDTVRNMIRNIERLRDFHRASAELFRNQLAEDLRRLQAQNPARFAEYALEAFKRRQFPEAVELSFEEPGSGRILYRTAGFGKTAAVSAAREYGFGAYRLRAAVNDAWVDDRTKTSAAPIIREQKYENGGYLWVNEVLNWSGGDNYAIRRVHPNLVDTEGLFLSTNTQDVRGSFPYLRELEGVRDSGEVYFTYFFKRPDNDRIAEKLTYATLYKDFNWIIAMGVYLEDVQTYIDAAEDSSRTLTARVVAVTVASLCALFAAALLILSRMEKRYLAKSSRDILAESNTDPLTGAFNRRIGDRYLADSFNKYGHGTESSSLLLFDLDDFKVVNDRFGHKVGDLVLKAVVGRVAQNMRSSDHLIRWGGEEFLVISYGIRPDGIEPFGEKLRAAIETLSIPVDETDTARRSIRVTASFGVAWFLPGDESPEVALLRADRALYRAKAAGKNRVRVQEPV